MTTHIIWRGLRFPLLLVIVLGLTTAALRSEEQPAKQPQTADQLVDAAALRRAIVDLTESFGQQYPRGEEFIARLDDIERLFPNRIPDSEGEQTLRALQSEALLANPLLDFERLLLIRRKSNSPTLGLPMNWQGNGSLPRTGFDDELAVLSPLPSGEQLTTLYKPQSGSFIGDVDLHFSGNRLLFSSIGSNNRWQVHELTLADLQIRQVTRGEESDVDNYDACYLPSSDIIFSSTACFQGVPCVTGSDHVANLCVMNDRGEQVRRLTFDQDHDWCPTVLENGRVLYLRWEYSDIPHFASRLLFQMNPDGTEQAEFYGSNSYWPNSMFYARPIPGHSTKFVAVISGHHDVPRMGELVLFDTAKGHQEADGVVQRIPGYGKRVEPIIRDDLVKASWPKFLHPWPLNDKYFIVSAQPTAESNWGIYLVDVFDNMLLLKESPGEALLEPIPLRPTTQPPAIPSRVQEERTDASVYMDDVYAGPGLAGVPRGTVKKLRLFTYHFAYHGMGGQVNRVGLDGPWDVKQVIGTVPVEEDGSAAFQIPANTPISVQPLDAEGKAMQLMRSWFVGMPGERVSCVGCHVGHHRSPANKTTLALDKPLAEVTSWYGATRGFSFDREVQPVLDQYCIRCHNGQPQQDGKLLPDLRRQAAIHPVAAGDHYNHGTKFSPSYLALRRFVRSPTIESDMHLLTPLEFHADTTRLIQMLRKGHHAVRLDEEAWDRLVTWIDLGTPAHGTWREIVGDELVLPQYNRRREMLQRYAGRDEDPEGFDAPSSADDVVAVEASEESGSVTKQVHTIPADLPTSKSPVTQPPTLALPTRQIDLGGGVTLDLVQIPAGEFLMGGAGGHSDEQPAHRVRIERPYWLGRFEITNQQFQRFDSAHDSRLEHGDFLQFSHEERGYLLDAPQQPVCRVSWNQALAFCEWLSQVTSQKFTLPSESQWEYACRAGTQSLLSYGDLDADFSSFANLADTSLSKVDSFAPWQLPVGAVPPWRPADDRFTDGYRVTAPIGTYQPNAWGLFDMHGNVAEWTSSSLAKYRQSTSDREDTTVESRRVVRGGSWYDRPSQARAGYRSSYWPFQQVYDVGFRVVCEDRAEQAP